MIYQPSELETVIQAFKEDDVIVFPTDTVYGIGARITSATAVDKIFEIKQRPSEKSLIILCANKSQLIDIVGPLTENVEKLVNNFLPGGLTLILEPKIPIIDEITRGKKTIGVRIPNHEVALELLKQVGPLATTSANVSGEPSPVVVDEKNPVVQNVELVIDGGPTKERVPSTILNCVNNELNILREGSLTEAMIKSVLID